MIADCKKECYTNKTGENKWQSSLRLLKKEKEFL
jgi:hypothetical protein